MKNIALRDHCTYGIGGPARFFFEPTEADELKNALVWAHKSDTPLFVLGKGSNLLISDRGFDGLVISTSRTLTHHNLRDNELMVESGADFSSLIEICCKAGLAGFEQLYDIPGTLGGAVYMNAGAFDAAVSDTLVEVVSMDKDGREHRRLKSEIGFAYRDSDFRRNGETILSARFNLRPDNPTSLVQRMTETLNRRNLKQPADRAKSCGSVFKRPPGHFAGPLIEKAGLKGRRIGEARISEKHANFIINDGTAKASDVAALIALCIDKVFQTSGVILETEVIRLGAFD